MSASARLELTLTLTLISTPGTPELSTFLTVYCFFLSWPVAFFCFPNEHVRQQAGVNSVAFAEKSARSPRESGRGKRRECRSWTGI